ncbi:Calvin cycle protein CP12 [Plectonema radiosum NIES-515]|uniref:Calvin cycle protein CP12 n=1 Tax=Plectonema radiosum NIES-515 TaxID=2986073 RepID=A0ABT3AY90_9CYAN|nr:Calvin cycle protein CP12 [Plectonema radiosum]MCV3213675.1 Calvin cycle protein CP12 [Plectonema radiosum NIES-515]
MTNISETAKSDIQAQINEEVEQARTVCDVSGTNSAECAAAWDAVEELQAEASHQRQNKKKNSLEQYCDDNPEAIECRIDDN